MSNRPPPTSNAPRRRRSLLSFSLKTILVLVVGCSCGMAWLVRKAQRQWRAMVAVEKLGGKAEYVIVSDNGQPAWLRPFLNDEYLVRVNEVYFHAGNRFTDDHVWRLAAFDEVQRLNLTATEISDGGLVHLAELVKLTELRLSETNISDEGLRHLEHMTALRKLYLNHTRVTDEGVARLGRRLPRCRILY